MHIRKTDQITFATGASFLGEKKGVANLIIAFSKVLHNMGRNDFLYLFGQIDEDIRSQYLSLTKELDIENNAPNDLDFHRSVHLLDAVMVEHKRLSKLPGR